LVIGILGADPFGQFLDETVRDETVHGRPLVVKRFHTVTEARNCHILYLANSEAAGLEQTLKALEGKPVLTVSDMDRAAGRGIAIGFVIEQNKIRFRINLKVARAANLNLSAKLLRVAQVVDSK
jgi:hypothetical protein